MGPGCCGSVLKGYGFRAFEDWELIFGWFKHTDDTSFFHRFVESVVSAHTSGRAIEDCHPLEKEEYDVEARVPDCQIRPKLPDLVRLGTFGALASVLSCAGAEPRFKGFSSKRLW